MRTVLAPLALSALAACSRPQAPKAAAAAADSPEARLIAADAGRSGDSALQAQYEDLNARFFGGRLPAVPVVWEPALDGVPVAGAPSLKLEGLWGRDAAGRTVILLNDSQKGDADKTAATLCHEMIHEYLDTIGRGSARHGPEFQAQLKRLHDAGAFAGEAPSDGEKKGLRDWLARQRAEIDAQALQLRAHPDEGLARRQNIMISDYNREAQRYNALNAYPDGLDEEASLK